MSIESINSMAQIEITVEVHEISKTQKEFNKVIKSIEKEKKALLAWQEMKPEFNQLASTFSTLQEENTQNLFLLIKLLDQASENPYFKKNDKKKIKEVILDFIDESFDRMNEERSEELKKIYNKYSNEDFDTVQKELEEVEAIMMKGFLESMFDFEFSDGVDTSSPEKLEEAARDFMKKKNDEQVESNHKKASARKKTAKELAAEEKKMAEEQNVTKSLKEVYRKLAGALHPDLELDALEKEKKTKLMQEVNLAYAKKDLLRLLELQLEIEQIDQNHLNNIAEDRMKYIVKILKSQLQDLKEEIREVTYPYEMMLGGPTFKITPLRVIKEIGKDINALKMKNRFMKKDLENFRDPSVLRRFLNNYF